MQLQFVSDTEKHSNMQLSLVLAIHVSKVVYSKLLQKSTFTSFTNTHEFKVALERYHNEK